ncbi:hypothetical protein FKX85_10860 [Echinicola soli]|uniref:Uncharacterized protein n=1 Tax=Echinicola soli TaxID=2591634 RepID=A0A514CIA7_9BACT|nr:DUF5687 family protein [Echinicola soli]QDH79510.1 hypothetical protein FKX85_10860 [Echinicola soli]
MIKHLVILQWKSFFRSAAFSSNLAIKILMGFAALYMMLSFGFLGVATFYILEKMDLNAFDMVNRLLVYYLVFDLIVRYMLQKMPVVQIKPLLFLPIKKSTIVQYSVWKTILSFFNIIHAFFFIPFAVVLVINGYGTVSVVMWLLGVYALLLANNFINIFLNGIDAVLFSVLGILACLGLMHYYGLFDISVYTGPLFQSLYDVPALALIPLALMVAVYWIAFTYFRKRLYLDAGLSIKQKEAKSENLEWLDRFGSISVFLKNDIKLIKRNKRSKTTVLMSVMFLFYGLLFFTNAIDAYQGPAWRIFAALFVTGGFLFSFGQYVPSWDSSYYPLMMSQNIRYRDYLNAKWWLMVMATVVSTILASFYAYFGWEVYLAILVAGIYNIGVNSYMVLWGGVYVRTPIDLSSNRGALGSSQAFNAKTLLLTIPKLLVPMILYVIGHVIKGPYLGYLLVVVSAVLGFAFKEKVFNLIEKNYKTEKYKTLAAYKQKS